MQGLERKKQRWHVLDRCRSEGQEKTKTPGNVSPGESQSGDKSLRRPYPRKPVLPRESLGRSCHRSIVQSASGTVPQFCGRRKAGARRGRRGRRGNRAVPELELQSRPSCERWGSPHGRTPLLSTPVRETGWTKARPILESSERVEKESSDKIRTTTSKDDLVRRLLGNGKTQETADGHPRADNDRNLLPPWRTTAVKARGLDQTHAWSGMRLVSAPPSCAMRRAKQNSKIRRHHRPQKSNLPMDHQSGSGIGRRSPFGETFRIPLRRIHERVSTSNTCSGVRKHCSVPMPPLGCVTGQGGDFFGRCWKSKREEDGRWTAALRGTRSRENWRKSSPTGTKVN